LRLPLQVGQFVIPGAVTEPGPFGAAAGAPLLCERGSRHWSEAMGRRGVQTALQLLGAVAEGHGGTAAVLAAVPQLLHLLHLMEGVAGGVALGPLAEGLLGALGAAGGPEVLERVAALRDATTREKKALALRKRETMLAKMGMVQVGAEAERRGGGGGAWHGLDGGLEVGF
jgi:hypothetical protein